MSDLEATVSVYKREMRAPDDDDVKRFPYRADIYLRDGTGDHHAVGRTAAEALAHASAHWHSFEQRKALVAAVLVEAV